MLAYLKVRRKRVSAFLTPGVDWLNTDMALLCGSWDYELNQLSCAASAPPQINLLGLEMSSSPPYLFPNRYTFSQESNPDEILRRVELSP